MFCAFIYVVLCLSLCAVCYRDYGRLWLVPLSLYVDLHYVTMLFHKESVLSVEIAIDIQWKATASSIVSKGVFPVLYFLHCSSVAYMLAFCRCSLMLAYCRYSVEG